MNAVATLPELILSPPRQRWINHLPWLHDAYLHAQQQFADQPHYRGETYRYSHMPRLLDMSWLYEANPQLLGDVVKPLHPQHYSLIFVDGVFAPLWSILPEETSWHYQTLAQIDAHCPAWLKHRLTQLPQHWSEQLNLLLAQQGIIIEIPQGLVVDKPIDIIHYYRNTTPTTMHTRHAIRLQAHAKAAIHEYHIGTNTAATLATTTNIIELDEHAHLDYSLIRHGNAAFYQLQHQALYLHEHATLQSFFADFGAQLLRTDLHAQLIGHHAKLQAKALFLAKQREQMEHQWLIQHHGRETESHSTLKGIADDEGQGICRGRIDVLPTAVKTNASLYNPNLLLSPRAQIDSLPELTILQDDVACAHGATVGQLDEQALFYLQSRGIALADARQLLTSAFIQSELTELPPYLYSYLIKQLPFQLIYSSAADSRISSC